MRRLERATGRLGTAATARMEETLPWFRQLPPDQRSWVGLVAQAGIAAFVAWYRDPRQQAAVTADVFGTAPRDLVRAISLQQTVEMVRTTISVVEQAVDRLAAPPEQPRLREGILRYSREVAFAAAEVYARAAEARGAWDARLEALVIDALLRDEADQATAGRAAALGWASDAAVVPVVGGAPQGATADTVEGLRRSATQHGLDLLTGVHADTLVAVAGGSAEPDRVAALLAPHFAPGPVVVGPRVVGLGAAGPAVREALAGLRAAPGWPDAPRPVRAVDLLPERLLAGDAAAATRLVREVVDPLRAADPMLLETLAAFLERSVSLEAAARSLYVHPNTVRYRLRRITELTGRRPTDPRDALALRLALVVARLGSPPAFVGFLQSGPRDVGHVVSVRRSPYQGG